MGQVDWAAVQNLLKLLLKGLPWLLLGESCNCDVLDWRLGVDIVTKSQKVGPLVIFSIYLGSQFPRNLSRFGLWSLYVGHIPICSTDAGVLVRKLRQLIPLSQNKRANPRCFILLCGISCELAGCVHRPIVDFESTTVGWGQTKP
jgi:hypothetical protein